MGGDRGAYEIGVWKALTDIGFKIGTGISMGDYRNVRDLWSEISYLSVMNISPAGENLLRPELSDFA